MSRNARIKSRCNHAGCRVLCADTHCDKHKAEHVWGGSKRASASERGYGPVWRDVIQPRIMARDKGMCQVCLKRGRPTQAASVDHIVPKSRGGGDEDSNLQAICARCHDVKTARERRERVLDITTHDSYERNGHRRTYMDEGGRTWVAPSNL